MGSEQSTSTTLSNHTEKNLTISSNSNNTNCNNSFNTGNTNITLNGNGAQLNSLQDQGVMAKLSAQNYLKKYLDNGIHDKSFEIKKQEIHNLISSWRQECIDHGSSPEVVQSVQNELNSEWSLDLSKFGIPTA